jgi:probable rRNA maturation factor
LQIEFISELSDFKLVKQDRIRNWIIETIRNEGKNLDNIVFIFVDKETIFKINSNYLNHNYLTDIISFNNSFLNFISGEIYICVPIVKENAILHSNNLFFNELNRIIIHGVLHLIGYDDSDEKEIIKMRALEEFYLSTFD